MGLFAGPQSLPRTVTHCQNSYLYAIASQVAKTNISGWETLIFPLKQKQIFANNMVYCTRCNKSTQFIGILEAQRTKLCGPAHPPGLSMLPPPLTSPPPCKGHSRPHLCWSLVLMTLGPLGFYNIDSSFTLYTVFSSFMIYFILKMILEINSYCYFHFK